MDARAIENIRVNAKGSFRNAQVRGSIPRASSIFFNHILGFVIRGIISSTILPILMFRAFYRLAHREREEPEAACRAIRTR